MTNGYVYALRDPRDGEFRYVGETCRALDARLRGHLNEIQKGGKDDGAKAAWLRELQDAGLLPEIVVLEEVRCAAVRAKVTRMEREAYWLTALLKGGAPLLNRGVDHTADAVYSCDLAASA